jgi:hypothetical protein
MIYDNGEISEGCWAYGKEYGIHKITSKYGYKRDYDYGRKSTINGK